jgi:hypothetical protein
MVKLRAGKGLRLRNKKSPVFRMAQLPVILKALWFEKAV